MHFFKWKMCVFCFVLFLPFNRVTLFFQADRPTLLVW